VPESEIDISAEWETQVSDEPKAASFAAETAVPDVEADQARGETIAETIEELRFYLAHSMAEQARVVFTKLEKLKPGAAPLAAVWQEIEAAEAGQKQPEAVEEVSVEDADEVPSAPEIERAHPAISRPAAAAEFVSDPRPAPAEEFKLPRRPMVPAPEPAVAEYAAASPEAAPAGVLGDFVSDLEASLGDSFLPPAPVPPVPQTQPRAVRESVAATSAHAAAAAAPALIPAPAPAPAMETASPTFTYQPTKKRTLAPEVAPATPQANAASVDLADMFGELKHELEEDSANTQEDPETHYNLGVAFREMGLLDEAIGELQKVCQAVDRGHSFPQLMQTYTWLAQCFLDKGVAEAAIRWYERALKLPNIDEETRTALNYELASSYEAAGDKTKALSYFMEVYGSNIDYRDVSERIKALKS
jgi:TolA-binding protein